MLLHTCEQDSNIKSLSLERCLQCFWEIIKNPEGMLSQKTVESTADIHKNHCRGDLLVSCVSHKGTEQQRRKCWLLSMKSTKLGRQFLLESPRQESSTYQCMVDLAEVVKQHNTSHVGGLGGARLLCNRMYHAPLELNRFRGYGPCFEKQHVKAC